MARTSRHSGITLRDVVNHISAFKQDITAKIEHNHRELTQQMDHVKGRMHTMESAIVHLQNTVNTLDTKVSNVDARLDVIEIAIVEQKHEKRIRRIERHLELSNA